MGDHVPSNGYASRTAGGLLLLFALTAQWSAVGVGPLQLSDLVLGALLVVLALGVKRPRRSPRAAGIAALLVAALAATALVELFPPNPAYLTQRFTGFGTGSGVALPGSRVGVGNAGLGPWAFTAKLALATAAVWFATWQVTAGDRDRVHRFLRWWLVGAGLSAAVAVVQMRTGWNPLGVTVKTGSRTAGLAFHPNTLALYCAAAIPLTAVWARRRPWLAATLLVVVWSALLSADSRAGLAAGIVCTLALPWLLGTGGTALAIVSIGGLVASPLVFRGMDWVTTHTRLAGAADSDAGRRMLVEQAVLDWLHSPVFGIGFFRGAGVPSGPMALLAGGGLIIALGFGWFLVWALRDALAARHDLTVRALLLSAAAIFAQMLVENSLTDRAQYVALLLAVLVAHRIREPRSAVDVRGQRQTSRA